MADIESKMSRSQFVKNTTPTLKNIAQDASPEAFTARASMLPPPRPVPAEPTNMERKQSVDQGGNNLEAQRPTYLLSTRPSDQSGSEHRLSMLLGPPELSSSTDDCGPLVKSTFKGKMSVWEAQVEDVLKMFFASIQKQPLPLFGNEDRDAALGVPGSAGFAATASGFLKRTPSMLSKSNSEAVLARGRNQLQESRMGSRWSSKTRSRPRLYAASFNAASSRTSFDADESAQPSPSVSSMWTSKYSMGKTGTSMSVNSFSSNFPQEPYKQSIGFANALSQAIIREETTPGSDDVWKVQPLLEDESLELAGAPWAKEGILKHKHHLESVDKKAKDRNWVECFVVIERGYVKLFQFNMNSKSTRNKTKSQTLPGGVVGGGNWLENAESLGEFVLRQTIASALPSPGYSKTRPHVWALSLPNGAVHLFQANTPEIVKEYVSTANYWSARLSKEPLMGGVSNIEYGWSDNVVNSALLQQDSRSSTNFSGGHRPSIQGSIRSSIDTGTGNIRPRLPGDKVFISDWMPPAQSMLPSALLEVDQLTALVTYVKNIEAELGKHNELRPLMILAYTTRHPNHGKAMQNWERKSQYLLREIVKFSTYVECLKAAQTEKERLYAKRKVNEVEAAELEGNKTPKASERSKTPKEAGVETTVSVGWD
jgi:hypothetical protein